ncbi:MAG: hypothetical protein AVDCRST_MAG20-2498, partial [uncultured Acidimicrobiales bacterium]
ARRRRPDRPGRGAGRAPHALPPREAQRPRRQPQTGARGGAQRAGGPPRGRCRRPQGVRPRLLRRRRPQVDRLPPGRGRLGDPPSPHRHLAAGPRAARPPAAGDGGGVARPRRGWRGPAGGGVRPPGGGRRRRAPHPGAGARHPPHLGRHPPPRAGGRVAPRPGLGDDLSCGARRGAAPLRLRPATGAAGRARRRRPGLRGPAPRSAARAAGHDEGHDLGPRPGASGDGGGVGRRRPPAVGLHRGGAPGGGPGLRDRHHARSASFGGL